MPLWSALAFEIVTIVSAQLVLKQGMEHMGGFDVVAAVREPALIFRLALNPFVLIGLSLYGAASLLWFHILSLADLSYAYPLLSLSYAVVLILSAVLFNEVLSVSRVLGVGIICTGVFVLSRS